MKWIVDDIHRALEQLKLWQTSLLIGLLALFAGLAYLVGLFAFRTDAVLLFLHRTVGSCRELNNGSIILMFCGMIFFLFTAVLTLGELQRYFNLLQRNADHQSGQALRGGSFLG